MTLTGSKWFAAALAVLGGAAFAVALPNPSVAGLAWMVPALLLFAARNGSAFKLGYLAGFTHYLISLSWLLQIPVRFYPILGWIALAAYLAVYPALWLWICTRAKTGIRPAIPPSWLGRLGYALLCATTWVALEMTVARMFSGFPWNLLGVTQHRLLPLVQIASWTGVYGVSFLIVWFSVSLRNAVELAIRERGSRSLWLREMALPLFVIALTYAAGLVVVSRPRSAERTLRVALVQPSIPQTMIWNVEESETRFRQLLDLTATVLTNKPDLLIWPEAAVPSLIRDDPDAQAVITSIAKRHNVWIIIGADDFDMRGTNRVYFNSSFLVSPGGELVSTYRKRRLVIFGEYVPLVDWLPFIKYLTPISGGFAAGEKPITFQLGTNGPRTSVLICFEDTFAHYAREHATEDVDFLVNITNDGWFGESAAQWQHAINAAFRSIENRLPLVRCSNNGVTCWIDANGAVHDAGFGGPKDVYRAGTKVVDVPLPARSSQTFYNRAGDWFGWTAVAIAAAWFSANCRRKSPGPRLSESQPHR